MDIGRGDLIRADQAIGGINADAVLVPEVAGLILLGPPGIQVLLSQPSRVVLPPVGELPPLDGCVLFAPVVLLGHRDDGGIDDLPATGGLDPSRLRWSLNKWNSCSAIPAWLDPPPEEPYGLGIRNRILHPQAHKVT